MNTGFSFRAYPSDPVAGVLLRWIGCQRFIYNAKVREDRYYPAFARRFAAFAGQHAPVDQAYSHLIGDGAGTQEADTTWLRQVPSPSDAEIVAFAAECGITNFNPKLVKALP